MKLELINIRKCINITNFCIFPKGIAFSTSSIYTSIVLGVNLKNSESAETSYGVFSGERDKLDTDFPSTCDDFLIWTPPIKLR